MIPEELTQRSQSSRRSQVSRFAEPHYVRSQDVQSPGASGNRFMNPFAPEDWTSCCGRPMAGPRRSAPR